LLAQTPEADVCVDFGIDTIRAKLYDDVNSKVFAQTWSWACSAHEGALIGAPPGAFRIELEGVMNGSVAWRGSQTTTIENGKTNDVGVISMSYVGSDKTAPTISSVSPADGSLNVPLTTSVSIKFSEPMAASTFINVLYLKNGSTEIPCTFFYDQVTNTATLKPTTALQPSTTYTIDLPYFYPRDMAGNYLLWNNSNVGPISFKFVTATVPVGGWKSSYIDAAFDNPVSIALDKYNGVHLSYIRNSNYTKKIGYATNWTGSWTKKEFNSSNSDASVIAVDRYDRVHIVYDEFSLTTKFSLMHVYEYLGNWNTSTIENGTVGYTFDAAIDTLDNLRIGYLKVGNAYYAENSGTNLTKTPLAIAKGSYTSIALTDSNTVHMIVAGSSNGSANAVYHLTNSSGSWTSETVVSGGAYSNNSIVADKNNFLHVLYEDSGKLYYATNASGNWIVSQPLTSSVDGFSLAVDASGTPHLCYYDYSLRTLRYANYNTGGWGGITVDDAVYSRYNSIAVDTNGYVHISYHDQTNGKVKYATNKP
jgi:hypothetical protein